ncbi:MAG: Winged helix DNA-binding domain [Marmoricola sp.]|jgi:DNA-binding MarR family transcriptional regulator|nr:Winged helix DNA-binding domain [Marmoricola sp.]
MTSVKGFTADEVHVPLLMGLLFREVRDVFASEDWGGLRQSHFRVITSVPPEGISVTELGERVGMTKQGCGQFVASLVESGHLDVEQDPEDRRVRRVRRTPLGNRTVTAVTRRMVRIEEEWAGRVGDQPYRTFRRVLEQLTTESDLSIRG